MDVCVVLNFSCSWGSISNAIAWICSHLTVVVNLVIRYKRSLYLYRYINRSYKSVCFANPLNIKILLSNSYSVVLCKGYPL